MPPAAKTFAVTRSIVTGWPPVSLITTSMGNSYVLPPTFVAMTGFGVIVSVIFPWPGVDVLFVVPARGVAQASGRSTKAMIASRFMRIVPLLHLRISHQRSDAASDARSGIAGRLRDEIVGIAVQDDGVADHGIRAGIDRDRVRHEARVNLTFIVRGDVAEIARMVRNSIGRAVNHRRRIEVTAGIGGVVAAVALLVNVEAVNARRHAGQIRDDFDAALAGILKV